ncbi:MAG: hypothetical protein JO264_07435 [Acidisphaera sp.]|nr:hypothetical protein [Acidisphaera sp.]
MRVQPDKKHHPASQKKKPFQPAIGKDFGSVDEVEARTRDFLARVIALGVMIMLLVSGGYGLFTGNYVPVVGVWSVTAPIIGALVTYYFGPKRDTE